MAYGKVTEDTVYTCTGQPLRSDIANILDWCLNKDFTTAYKRILQLVRLEEFYSGAAPYEITNYSTPFCVLGHPTPTCLTV